jgi:hypothetical protein
LRSRERVIQGFYRREELLKYFSFLRWLDFPRRIAGTYMGTIYCALCYSCYFLTHICLMGLGALVVVS